MEIFSTLVSSLSRTPEWVYLGVLPACALVSAVTFALCGLRKIYPFVAAGLSILGASLAATKEAAFGFVYCGISATLYLFFALFLLLPAVKRKKKESREERVYRKFHAELETPPEAPDLPPKVCCYEEPATAEESGMRLSYVTTLIGKLKNCKLVPSDRLELEALGHSVDACRGRALTGEELSSLNDCLASVLKLTAKYKL